MLGPQRVPGRRDRLQSRGAVLPMQRARRLRQRRRDPDVRCFDRRVSNANASTGATLPYCDTATDRCVQCLTDDDCGFESLCQGPLPDVNEDVLTSVDLDPEEPS
jgi:hypothetical protein